MNAQFINEVCTTIKNLSISRKVRFHGKGGYFASPVLEGYLCGKIRKLTPEKTAEILGTEEFGSIEDAWYKIFRRFLDDIAERDVTVEIKKMEVQK